MKKAKARNTASSLPVGVGIGLLVSLILTVLGAALTAYLVDKEIMAQSNVGYGCVISLLVSACCGAYVSVKRVKRLRMRVCIASGACYYLLLLGITALFFGGQYEGMGITALVVLGGCLAVAIAGMSGGKSRKSLFKKSAYR